MDWIERVLHVSPDGGSGATELLHAGGVLVVLAAVAARPVHRRMPPRQCARSERG